MNKQKTRRLVDISLSYTMIILMAVLLAFNYYIFIIKNNFAPAGLNGIATMVQYKTGFSISYMSLLINVPLCILYYFLAEKKYAVRTLVFCVAYSVAFLLLQNSGLSFIQYDTGGYDTIFPVIISGVISGFVSGICLRYTSSTGGMDIVSKYINRIKPEINLFLATFILNAVVAVISLFVYSDDGVANYKPVALCITYCFVLNYVGNYIIKGTKTAYKFTVITSHSDEIIQEITTVFRHGVTKVSGEGMYTQTEKNVLLCVVNKHQVEDFKKLVDKYEDTFSFFEVVNETVGNFKHVKN